MDFDPEEAIAVAKAVLEGGILDHAYATDDNRFNPRRWHSELEVLLELDADLGHGAVWLIDTNDQMLVYNISPRTACSPPPRVGVWRVHSYSERELIWMSPAPSAR